MHIQKKKGTVHENLEGSIERWFSPRGYGFIEIPGKGDVFVHVNDIEGLNSTPHEPMSQRPGDHPFMTNVWGHSLKGSKVRFDVVETVRGYKAKKVKIVEKSGHNSADQRREGHRSPREPNYPMPPAPAPAPAHHMHDAFPLPQLDQPSPYHPMPGPQLDHHHEHHHPATSRESIHRARRRMEEAMGVDPSASFGVAMTPDGTPVPHHVVANMMRGLSSSSSVPSGAGYQNVRRLYHPKGGHAEQPPVIRYHHMPLNLASLPQMPESQPNPFREPASPLAYSDMAKQSMGRIVQELAPDLRFYEGLVDYIMEFAGTISLSLINFNDVVSKTSRAMRYQHHMRAAQTGLSLPPRIMSIV